MAGVKISRKPYRSKPCEKCPFKVEFSGDDDYLREGRRAVIVRSLLDHGRFPCHETLTYEGNSTVDESKSRECAGAMLVMYRDDRSSQWMRIMERLGDLDPDEFMAANDGVDLWTFDECIAGRRVGDDEDDVEIECCSVVGPDCEAPAGYMIGGQVVRGSDSAANRCEECGEPVCDACMNADGRCFTCAGWPDDDDDLIIKYK